MIMQQAAVLHPDAARHTHTVIQFLLSGCDNANASWTKKEICAHIAAPHPNLRPPPHPTTQFTNIKTHAKIENTWAPGLTLHYEVCEPVFLSLSPSLASLSLYRSFFLPLSLSACSWLAGSQLSSTPSPSPTAGVQSQAAPLRASQPALTSLA